MSPWFFGIAGLLVIVSLYVLSFGPAIMLHESNRVAFETIYHTYYPLLWLCEQSTIVEGALTWYVNLWIYPGVIDLTD